MRVGAVVAVRRRLDIRRIVLLVRRFALYFVVPLFVLFFVDVLTVFVRVVLIDFVAVRLVFLLFPRRIIRGPIPGQPRPLPLGRRGLNEDLVAPPRLRRRPVGARPLAGRSSPAIAPK